MVLADRSYAEHSQRLYASLFGRFCQWLRSQEPSLSLATLGSGDIGRFLDDLQGRAGKVATARTRRTYLAEIDRVFRHLQEIGLRQNNPAAIALEQARFVAPLRPRNIHLPAADMPERFYALLDSIEPHRQALPGLQVQAVCMALLMLECGLTVKELQKLNLAHCRLEEGQIHSPGHRTILARDIDLSGRAVQWLADWLQIRRSLRVVDRRAHELARQDLALGGAGRPPEAGPAPRQALFVQFSRRGGGDGQTPVTVDLVGEKTVYEAAEGAVLAQLPRPQDDRPLMRHRGPQVLRNLACARMVNRGMATAEVARALGLRRNDQVWAMRRQMGAAARVGLSDTRNGGGAR